MTSNNGEKGIFDIGWDEKRGTVTIEYDCCTHLDPGQECVHLTPEKAVFLAQLILEKVLNIWWSKK